MLTFPIAKTTEMLSLKISILVGQTATYLLVVTGHQICGGLMDFSDSQLSIKPTQGFGNYVYISGNEGLAFAK